MTEDKTERIRALNDALRTTGQGGTILLTQGIQQRGQETIQLIVHSIQVFDDFTEDNDPHQEHDFGIVTIDGERIYWKIDYYDGALEGHSPDPANPDVTHRVLTIMLAAEY